MNRKILTTGIVITLLLCLSTSVFADSTIKLFFNGQEIKSDAQVQVVDGDVLVHIDVISELFGANVKWDEKTNSIVIDSEKIEAQKSRIRLLEQALAPKDPITAVNTWAEGVKMRNGALQYAVMSSKLKEELYDHFVGLNWSTGTSSPWVKSYRVSEKYKVGNETCRFELEFVYTDSTSSTFSTKEYITVNNFEGNWLISSIEKIDVKGKITKLSYDDDKKVKSIFIEDNDAEKGSYDKANVIISENTKIYKGYTDSELPESDLKEGVEVEVAFTDDPRTMIYPVTAEAEIIRVKDEAEQINSIVYENIQHGFRFSLPKTWEGYRIVTDKWEGLSIADSKTSKIVETGPIIYIRHPQWTSQNPRQDIPIMIFTLQQWNLLDQGEFHIGAAPMGPSELGRNSGYVFALPARYNYEFLTGYEEVDGIIKSNPLEPIESTETGNTQIDTQVVKPYFISTEEAPGGLYPVYREVPKNMDPVQAAIEQMLCGPTEAERQNGYRSHFSQETAGMLRGITYSDEGDTVTIDFADFRDLLEENNMPSPTSFGPGGVMADITWTVFKQFPQIQALRFAFEGDESEFWSWLVGEPSEPEVFTRTDWEQV